ncbi:MAG TPA: EAL domain-containing protein [Gammaproteobacteria bacterium]|nr:EAL domain-containing protein [Gammaproteobacteria bacterium]
MHPVWSEQVTAGFTLRWPATSAFILCALLTVSGFLTPLEWSLTDVRARLGSHIVQTDLAPVETAPGTLREEDGWPWPLPVPLLLMALLILSIAHPLRVLGWRKGLVMISATGILLLAVSVFAYSKLNMIFPLAPLLVLLVVAYSFTVFSKLDQQALQLMLQNLSVRRKDALMANIVHNSIEGIVAFNADGAIRDINPAACSMFGLTRSDAINRKFSTLVPDLKSTTQLLYTLNPATNSACVQETSALHRDGHTFPIEIAVSRLSFEGDELCTAFIRNISERNAQQAALRHQATHDVLTGLGNRSLLQERLEQLPEMSCPTGKSVAVLMLDLNRFKEINDTLGHHVGDLVLKEVSRRLASAVGSANMLARFGGDEFAILIPTCSEREEIVEVADRLLDSLKPPIEANGMRLMVGGSIGIALYPENGRTPGALLQCADVAMYLAKRTQSGYAMYDEKLDKNSLQRLTIASDLRTAIESDELRLFYQPQVEISTGKVVCVEALLRWHHPELGVINPVDVMEIAEGTELIMPLTVWTLRTALEELAELRHRGCSIDVAVNLSARLLHDLSLPKILQDCLNEICIPPDWLILEITESAIISDPERALVIAQQIAAMGIRLSIDDFGTGYSSLSYLKHLPACELKIDKSFVIDMLGSENDTMIVRSTIDLAHNLGMCVVAEGIENEEVWSRLKQMDCDIAQGYWIARPMLLCEFRKWLARWSNTEQTIAIA